MMDDTTASTACEDLKAFERRLTEVVAHMQPAASRWRVVLVIAFLCTVYSAYFWVMDPSIREVGLYESLTNHVLFAISLPTLLVLFIAVGIHKRVVGPSIIASRCRQVLSDFNLSCDDSGKLILKPAQRSNGLNSP
uniref:Transmembrane protein 188 n=1 Tax=Plectus sambesii TaxID=2011161 RepID=A0A914UUK8_9BILA